MLSTLRIFNREAILVDKSFSILPLFTEGFIGPIRTLILLLYYGNIISCLKFIWFELFRLSNPFSAYFFIYYLNKIFKNLDILLKKAFNKKTRKINNFE